VATNGKPARWINGKARRGSARAADGKPDRV
jgi:hypothetical protein